MRYTTITINLDNHFPTSRKSRTKDIFKLNLKIALNIIQMNGKQSDSSPHVSE